MSKLSRWTLGMLGAAVMLAALASSASARNLSSSIDRFRVTWTLMTFTEPLGASTRCPVTLEGSLHTRSFAKGNYNLIGSITAARVGDRVDCVGGEATVLRETLPWNVRYQSFEGTLPEIRRIRTLVAGASFRVRVGGGPECLFTSRETTTEHIAGVFIREVGTRELSAVEVRGEIRANNCLMITGRLTGTSNVPTVLNEVRHITVTLI